MLAAGITDLAFASAQQYRGLERRGIGVPLPEDSSYAAFILARLVRRIGGGGATRGTRLPARGGDAVVDGSERLTFILNLKPQ
ncbi:MAG TPA: hypothetical protein VLB06_05245 [Sulfuricaulis sp.]|nr:hypothetical protein [Sulfuricaulis sp.]